VTRLEHNLSKPAEEFSAPKSITAKGVPFQNAGYVYILSFRNPETEKFLERMKRCVRESQFVQTQRRRRLGRACPFTKKSYVQLLRKGYIPLDNNSYIRQKGPKSSPENKSRDKSFCPSQFEAL